MFTSTSRINLFNVCIIKVKIEIYFQIFNYQLEILCIFHSNAFYSNAYIQKKRIKIKVFHYIISPKKTILLTLKGCLKSTLFLSSMVGTIRYVICKLKSVNGPLNGTHGLLIGFFSGISILCESDGKACEMTL